MNGPYRVLLVSENEALVAAARECLAGVQPEAVLQPLKDPWVATARLGGGDIQMVLVDPDLLGGQLTDWLRKLRPFPTVVITGDWRSEVSRRARTQETGPKMIGFIGCKGGVGTSTVSINIAYGLAAQNTVLLTELASGVDTFALHVAIGSASSPIRRWAAERPGLRLMLRDDLHVSNPAEFENSGEDIVVLDLGSVLTEPVRAQLPRLGALTIVTDWETLSIDCARRLLNEIAGPGGTPMARVRAMIVNRSGIASPPGLDDVASALGIPILGVVPPAADLCCAATKARRAVVSFDSQSMVAESLALCAKSIAAALEPQRGEIRGFSRIPA
jgi:MinD-like ATPase involved in chromosome partitioning or flagellar assembly